MKLNIKKQAPEILGLAVGGIGAGYVTKLVPVGNEKIKAAAPLLIGVLLSGQKGILGSVGKGMIAAGGANLAKTFGIGGVDTTTLIGEIDEFEIEGMDDVDFSNSGESEF
jgi:hypothetical protein